MLRVGITGGIGSGKTTVCKIFESIGIAVYYADAQAKELMYRDPNLKSAIKALLGTEAYHSNGRPNRKVIATKIFADKALLQGINQLVHPAVRAHFLLWSQQQTSAYVLQEAALLVENGSYQQMDALITVTAPLPIRVARVMARDKVTESAVMARVSSQLPEEEKVAVADYVINNDGQHSLVKQVWSLHNRLTRAAK